MCVRRDGDPGGQDLNAELATHKASSLAEISPAIAKLNAK